MHLCNNRRICTQLPPDGQSVNVNGNCDMLMKFHSYTDTQFQTFGWISLVCSFYCRQICNITHIFRHASVSSNYDKVSVSRPISLLPPPMWSYPKGHGYGGQQGEGGCGLFFYFDVQLFRKTARCISFLIQQCIMICSLFIPAPSLTKNTTVLHIT